MLCLDVERLTSRIEGVLQSHHFRSSEELEATLHRYVWLCSQQLPQSALGSKSPLQAMKDWHKLKAKLFRKQPYCLPGCDSYLSLVVAILMFSDKNCRGSSERLKAFVHRAAVNGNITALGL